MAVLLLDSFTDTDGTQLTAHTPETGGAWAISLEVGSELVLASNRLTKVSGGGTRFYNAATIPANDIYVEAVVRFFSSAFCSFTLARSGVTYGNADKFLILNFNSTSSSTLGSTFGAHVDLSTVLSALNTDYVLRVEFATVGSDTFVTYKVDGAVVKTRVIVGNTAWFTGAFGGEIYEFNAVAALGVSSITIGTIDPAAPATAFWTANVLTTEVLA